FWLLLPTPRREIGCRQGSFPKDRVQFGTGWIHRRAGQRQPCTPTPSPQTTHRADEAEKSPLQSFASPALLEHPLSQQVRIFCLPAPNERSSSPLSQQPTKPRRSLNLHFGKPSTY